VAALSGAVDPAALERGLAGLRDLGFVPVPARNLEARWGILAGDDDARIAAFHELVADESLSAVFFARGGYGAMRLLPRLDWDLVGRRPRAWIGYSDLTPFLLQVVQRWGLVTFHGPMVATDMARGLGEEESASLCRALAGEETLYYPLRWLRPGEAEGPVLGGCLSLLTAVLGTPWATPLDGALLFVEDVNEPLHRVDRMLTHLRLSGNLTRVHGMLGGYFGGEWEQAIGDETQIATSWHRETLLALPFPLAWSVPCGHGVPNLTLPLGAHGWLDVANGRLEVAAP
jgi:muramoyltetrapeptide carboxypeptidase